MIRPIRGSNVSAHNTTTRWKQIIWSCQADNGPLLIRYFLIRTRWFGVYLHHFLASDEDRALHDHPWGYIAFLFHSGYWEWIPRADGGSERMWRRRFSILIRPATWQHRVELPGHYTYTRIHDGFYSQRCDNKPVWTLVFRGPIRREWGFWLPEGWTHWKDYGKRYCD